MYAPIPFRPFRDWQRALDALRPRLFVAPDTEQDARLQQAMRELLIETSIGYVIKGAQPGRLALISWRPVSMLQLLSTMGIIPEWHIMRRSCTARATSV